MFSCVVQRCRLGSGWSSSSAPFRSQMISRPARGISSFLQPCQRQLLHYARQFSWNFSSSVVASILRSPFQRKFFATEQAVDTKTETSKIQQQTPLPPPTPEQQEYEQAIKDPNPKFAVVYVSGHQYKVTAGDFILVTKLEAPVGSRIALTKVLLAGSAQGTLIGTPLVKQARVFALVEQHVLTDKVYVFKKRRRKNSQRTRGVRHPVTQLRIMNVEVTAEGL